MRTKVGGAGAPGAGGGPARAEDTGDDRPTPLSRPPAERSRVSPSGPRATDPDPIPPGGKGYELPRDPAALAPRPRGLEIEGRGSPLRAESESVPRRGGGVAQGAGSPRGSASLFAFRIGTQAHEVPTQKRPLAFEPIPTGAKTIDELLARLPLQPEITRIEAALAARAQQGGVPLAPLPAMKAELPESYRDVMDRLGALTRFLNPVELFTADDVAKVKDEFLAKYRAGEPENPTFRYEKSTGRLRATLAARGTTLDALEGELRELSRRIEADAPKTARAGLFQQALLAKLADDLATITLARGLERRDDNLVLQAFSTKYGRGVDPALLDAARVVFGYLVENQSHAKKPLAPPKDDAAPAGAIPAPMAAFMTRRENMTAQEFKGAIEWMLERYYLHYEQKTGQQFPEAAKYTVEVDNKYSAIDVRDKSSDGPVIGIPDKSRSYKKYLELLRHEVDQHVRQSLNGQLMFGFGGGALKVDEEVWYEGLAKSAEIRYMRATFGDESEPTLPYFTFAIELAEQGKSFVEVFEELRRMRMAAGNGPKIAEDNAWSATYRAFRGHIDTANAAAYALPKDQAYLRGWMLQSQLEARGLGYLNESAICQLEGLTLLARFEYGPGELLFPDLDLTSRYFQEVLRPRVEQELIEEEAERRGGAAPSGLGDTAP